jgi:hypothetical protein
MFPDEKEPMFQKILDLKVCFWFSSTRFFVPSFLTFLMFLQGIKRPEAVQLLESFRAYEQAKRSWRTTKTVDQDVRCCKLKGFKDYWTKEIGNLDQLFSLFFFFYCEHKS